MIKVRLLLIKLFLFICLVFKSGQLDAQPTVIDEVIAQVGDEIVLLSNIQEQKLQAIQQGQKIDDKSNCFILEEYMFQELLLNQAKIDSIMIPENQVLAEMDNRLRYFEMQIGGRDKLEEFYGKSVEEIKEEFYGMIEESMMVQEMERTITSDVKVSPKEVREFYNSLPKDSIPYINSQIEYARIVFKPKISQKSKQEIIDQLEGFREDFISGEKSFSTYAALYSDDPGSSSRGGEFDFVPKGTFVPEFDAVAFELEEGEISQVFETDYGFHILQLIERRGNEYKGRHILRIPKVDLDTRREVMQKADSVYQLIKMDKLTFAEAAERYSEDESTKLNGGKVFNPQTGDSKWDVADIQKNIFLTIDNMDEGDVSKPIVTNSQTGKQEIHIMKLTSRSKPHIANLRDDYNFIRQATMASKKQDVIDDWINGSIDQAYIKITDDFKGCPFKYNWIKEIN